MIDWVCSDAWMLSEATEIDPMRLGWLFALALALAPGVAAAQNPTRGDVEFFESKVRPLLVRALLKSQFRHGSLFLS